MISFNIELNSKPIGETKVHNLLLRITVNRKHARLGLMYSINPIHFNPKGKAGNYIRSSHPKHAKINSYIDEKISAAKDAITYLEKDGKLITAKIY